LPIEVRLRSINNYPIQSINLLKKYCFLLVSTTQPMRYTGVCCTVLILELI